MMGPIWEKKIVFGWAGLEEWPESGPLRSLISNEIQLVKNMAVLRLLGLDWRS